MKKFLVALLSLVLVLSCIGLIACTDKSDPLKDLALDQAGQTVSDDFVLPLQAAGKDIEWSSNSDAIALTKGADGWNAVVTLGASAKNVKLTAKIGDATKDFTVKVAANVLTSYVLGEAGSYITKDFVLPLQIAGTDVVWTSSDTTAISIEKRAEDYLAAVTLGDETVTVTLTVSQGKATKSFELMVAGLDVEYLADSFTFVKENTTVVADFDLPRSVTVGSKTATITWSVDANKYGDYIEISEDGNTCIVTQSSLNPTVRIVATFTLGEETTQRPYKFTVSVEKNHLEEVNYWYNNTGVSVTMSGYVVAIGTAYSESYQNVTLYMVDDDFCAGYYLYRVKTDVDTGAKLVPGVHITVTGTTNTNYNGLIETNAGGTLVIDADIPAIDVSEHVYAIDQDILGAVPATIYHESTLVSLTNWKVKEVKTAPAAGATGTLFILTKGGVDVPVVISKYMEGAYLTKAEDATWTALCELCSTVKVDDIVSVTGILGNYKGFQIIPLSAADVVVGGEADPADTVYAGQTAAAAVKAVNDAVAANALNKLVTSNISATLPTDVGGVKVVYELCGSSRAISIEDGELAVVPSKHEKVSVKATISVYNNDEVVYSTVVFFGIESVAMNDADKVAAEAADLDLTSKVEKDETIALPATGKTHTDVAIAWDFKAGTTHASAVIDNGKLIITRQAEAETITLVATLSIGDTVETKEFTIEVAAAPADKTTSAVLNATALGLDATYSDGTDKDINGVKFSYNQLYVGDLGIQWRDKSSEGKALSSVWNTTALSGKIVKITITMHTGKVYNNEHALWIEYATDAAFTNATKVAFDTVKDTETYEIVPEGDFTFVRLTIGITYIVYIDSIEIEYVGNGEAGGDDPIPADGISVADFLAKAEDSTTEYTIYGWIAADGAADGDGSFVLVDATGAVFSYAKANVNVGDYVKVVATRSSNYGVPQLGTKSVEVLEAPAGAVNPYSKEKAEEWDIATIDLSTLSADTVTAYTGKLYKFTNVTLTKTNYVNGYYNGAQVLSLYSAGIDEALINHEVVIYGYVRGCSTNKYLTVQIAEVELVGGGDDSHVCAHVCPVCGKCLDADCTDPACADKCQGHAAAATVTVADFLAKAEDTTEYVIYGWIAADGAGDNAGSFVLVDATGAVFSYTKATVSVGDYVKVVATRTSNYGVPQLGTKSVEILEAPADAVNPYSKDAAEAWDVATIDLSTLSADTIAAYTGKLYKFTNVTLKKPTSYVNGYYNDAQVLSLYSAGIDEALIDQEVVIYGYVRGCSTNKYLTVQIAEVELAGTTEDPDGDWNKLDLAGLSTWDYDYTVEVDGNTATVSHSAAVHTPYVNVNKSVEFSAQNNVIRLVITNNGTENAYVKVGAQTDAPAYACVLSSALLNGEAVTDLVNGVYATIEAGKTATIEFVVDIEKAPVKLFIALNSEGEIGTNPATGNITIVAHSKANETPVLPHECAHACPECGKCMDTECTDPACADKCQGHQPATTKVELNVSDLEAATYTAETELVPGISVMATEAKNVVIDGNKKSIDGYDFTLRIKLNGTGALEHRNIKITVDGPATITVYAMSGKAGADRELGLHDSTGAKISGHSTSGDVIAKYTYTVDAAGTYYLWSLDSGINIYYLAVETEPAVVAEKGTESNPYTVEEALEIAKALTGASGQTVYAEVGKVYVSGVLSEISRTQDNFSGMLKDAASDVTIEIYKCSWSETLTTASVNDTIVLCCYIANYSAYKNELTGKTDDAAVLAAREVGTSTISYETNENADITVSATSGLNGETFTISVVAKNDAVINYVKVNNVTVDAVDGVYTATIDGNTHIVVSATVPTVGGGTASAVFADNGYENAQAISSITLDSVVSISLSKGTNNNDPKYYNSGTAIRCYGGNTFTVTAAGKTITQIVLTFGASDGSNEITVNVGSFETTTWTGSASEVTFTIGGTSGNRRIASIEVTYE